ncbi:MAG: glutathione S-transferase [Acidimicrobiales bacterium]|nr:glutathione S-transferase [Acidimicrobiales bacterium]
MSRAVLTINSRNYGAWSLRGWLLCQFTGLDVEVVQVPADDPDSRAELTFLSPSFQVPRLDHDGVRVWGLLSIAEYLNEICPDAGLLPKNRPERALCRSVCSEVHSGFMNLRTALPMNLRVRHANFPVWQGAQADIDRVTEVWQLCLETSGGPLLFGDSPTMADAMYAPECTRFRSYGVALPPECAAYRDAVLALPELVEWTTLAANEPDEVEELDIEF